jgi:hypothetical protein
MSDKPNEGNLAELGGAGANSTPSTTAGQPLEADLTVAIAKLQKTIDAQQGEINALKSGKDKAVDRVVKSQEETFAKLAKYLNVDESQVREAQRQAVLDDLVSERLGGRQPASPIGGTVEKQSAAAELQIIDELLELPANDSRVTDLKLKYGSDITAYGREAKKLKESFNQTPATPAEQIPPEGRAAVPAGMQQLQDDYLKELSAARGKGNRFGDAIKDKYRKKGLNVDEISIRV